MQAQPQRRTRFLQPHLAAFDPRHDGLLWNLWFVGGTLVQGLVYSYPSKRRSNGATVGVSVLFVPCCFCCSHAAHSMQRHCTDENNSFKSWQQNNFATRETRRIQRTESNQYLNNQYAAYVHACVNVGIAKREPDLNNMPMCACMSECKNCNAGSPTFDSYLQTRIGHGGGILPLATG